MKKSITFIIPTLNSAKILPACLQSIKKQNYPWSKINIIIADGGSTDTTISQINKFKKSSPRHSRRKIKIINNPLKTAEAAKAIGLKSVKTQLVCFLDSDNILPHPNWLSTMTSPFSDLTIIGSEPWAFTYRKKAGFIERYSSLIGANDPYAFVSGLSDRLNYLNHQWTSLKLKQVNQNRYIKITLKPNQTLPTIGANGTIFRTNFVKKTPTSKYLFDIDLILHVLNQNKQSVNFAKVKIGIIHTFCESSISKFIKKQKRRLVDYYQYQDQRLYNWQNNQLKNNIRFIFHTFFISPFLSIIGYTKKPDPAWFFHPIACYLSLYIYTLVTLKHHLGLLAPISRTNWKQ